MLLYTALIMLYLVKSYVSYLKISGNRNIDLKQIQIHEMMKQEYDVSLPILIAIFI